MSEFDAFDATPEVSLTGHSETIKGACEMNLVLRRWLQKNDPDYFGGTTYLRQKARAEAKEQAQQKRRK